MKEFLDERQPLMGMRHKYTYLINKSNDRRKQSWSIDTERFRTRYLEDCDMRFLKMEDMHPRLPIALILSYKRNTHAKKKGRAINQGEKPQRNNKRIYKREIEG